MSVERPLFLHIGLQKTGTSYLQGIFWKNRTELARQGLDLVPDTKRGTFELMLRVRDRFEPEFDRSSGAAALERFPGELAATTGTRALVTEESLAPASPAQIAALLDACAGREVHVIVTVRDLGRVVPSAWQQSLQAGRDVSFSSYLARMRKTEGIVGHKAWSSKDVPEILERWASLVPLERIHVVTVPASGGDPELLLRRFCSVLDVDAGRLDREVERSNQGLGRVQAEVLRMVNSHLPAEYRRRDVYGDIGKRFFAVQILAPQGGEKCLLPAGSEAWVREVSARHAKAIADGGYHIVGDLSDLEPAASAFAEPGESAVDHAEVAERAAEALAAILVTKMDDVRRRRARSAAQPAKPPRAGWLRALRR